LLSFPWKYLLNDSLFAVVGNVSRWEKTLSELDEALQEKQTKEKDTKDDVDRLVQNFDKIKKEISEVKAEITEKVLELTLIFGKSKT
jgi:peptidoglycan hydrolase CwlO-like protein